MGTVKCEGPECPSCALYEGALVKDFTRAHLEYERLHDLLEKHFMPFAYDFAKEGNVEGIQKLLDRCPESVVRVFLMDQLQQAKKAKAKRERP